MKIPKLITCISTVSIIFIIFIFVKIIYPQIPCNIQSLGACPNNQEFDNFYVFKKAFETKKSIFIPDGEYYILTDETLYIPSDFKLTMDKNAKIIIKSYKDFPKNIALVSKNTVNVNIDNLNIFGWKLPSERNGSNGFVSFDDCVNLSLTGKTQIGNANRAAVMFCGGKNIYVENMAVSNCNADGVYIQGNVSDFNAEYINVINSGDDAVSIANNLTINEYGENTDGSFQNYPHNINIDKIYVDGYSKNVSVSSPAVFVAGARDVHIGRIICKHRNSVLRTNVGCTGEALSSNFGGDFRIDEVVSYDTRGLFLFEFKDISNYKEKEKYKTNIKLGDIVCYDAIDLGYIGNNCGGLWENLCSVEINSLKVESSNTNVLCLASCHNLKINHLEGAQTTGIIRSSLANSTTKIQKCFISQLDILYGAQNVSVDEFVSNNSKSSALNINTGGDYAVNKNIVFKSVYVNNFNQGNGNHFTDSAVFITGVDNIQIEKLFIKNNEKLIDGTYAVYSFGKNVVINYLETELMEKSSDTIVMKNEDCSIVNKYLH